MSTSTVAEQTHTVTCDSCYSEFQVQGNYEHGFTCASCMGQQIDGQQIDTGRKRFPDDPGERLTMALKILEFDVQRNATLVAELLCPVDGYAKQWEDICKLSDRIRKEWDKLSRRMGGVCSGHSPQTTHHIRNSKR